MSMPAVDNNSADKAPSLQAFAHETGLTNRAMCAQILASEQTGIQVRNKKIAADNLTRIIEATLSLANRKGFAAMSLRELARASDLSLGGLYAYIQSKAELAQIIQTQASHARRDVMARRLTGIRDPGDRLAEAIRSHLFASELLRPWFFFLYMEAHHLDTDQRRTAISMEQASEETFAAIIRDGQAAGVFRPTDAAIAAGMLKALLQDWYLKHRKHHERGLDVATYAEHVQTLIQHHLNGQTP